MVGKNCRTALKNKKGSQSGVKKNETKPEKRKEEKKIAVKAILFDSVVMTENSNEARLLHEQGKFGSLKGQHVQLSLIEAAYLSEKGKILVLDKKKEMGLHVLACKAKKLQPDFWIRYQVYADLRNRGYIIKTALKFGADFRVYDRGVKPGEDHARWIVYPVNEMGAQTWYEFSAKNRVAHSTKKRLMIAVVDDEGDVSYWEVRWLKP